MKKIAYAILSLMLFALVGCDDFDTVTIGKQVWMAKNLNIETEDSWCYDDKPENCEKYGRRYTWEAAQHVCPSGWHLPSKYEFEKLIEFAGDYSSLKEFYGVGDGAKFWSSTEHLSHKLERWGNSNDYSSSIDNSFAYFLRFNGLYADVIDNNKDFGYSVRCLQD